MTNFKISLKACRANADMTADAFGSKVGVSKTTILSWEKGETVPDARQLIKISQLSGVPVDFIFIPTA